MLVRKEENTDIIWGIWKIDESLETLTSMLDDTTDLQTFKEKHKAEARLLEKAAVRVLLKTLIGSEQQIKYHDSGKPYLSGNELNISITHTKGYAALALSKSDRLGIDIERISERVKKIKTKFISDQEYIDPHNETLHLLLHWSAKETMYKALDKEGVDLKEHLSIKKFIPEKKNNIEAFETYTKESHQFNIQYFAEENYVLTLTY